MRDYEAEHVEIVERDVVMIVKDGVLAEVEYDEEGRGDEGGGV